MLEEIYIKVLHLLKKLPQNELVCLTSGNISARDVDTGFVVIKPSGVPYEELTTFSLVVVD